MPKVNLNQKFVNEDTCPPQKNRVDYYDTTLIGPLPSPVPRPSLCPLARPRRLAEQPPARFMAAAPPGPDPETVKSSK